MKYREDADKNREIKNAIHMSNLKGKNGRIHALSFLGFGTITVQSLAK